MPRLALLIVARNLGDAVVQSSFLRELAGRGWAQRFVVWTRPASAFLFADLAACTLVLSEFPVGTNKNFGPAAALRMLEAAARIRRLGPDVSIDLVGDVRERVLARLAGAARHLHIGWAAGHPFARLIRNPFGTGTPAVVVPAEVPNVYAAHRLMLDHLAPPNDGAMALRPPAAWRASGPSWRVGLHPFASQACKLWPDARWRELALSLLAEGAVVVAFGAPAERDRLLALFGGILPEDHLSTEGIAAFAAHVSRLDLMIGLDSFSVHMAERERVASLTINAGNPPELWRPPSGRSLASSGGCPHYPCYNVPRCEPDPGPYACIRSIGVDAVLHEAASQRSAASRPTAHPH